MLRRNGVSTATRRPQYDRVREVYFIRKAQQLFPEGAIAPSFLTMVGETSFIVTGGKQ